MKYIAIYFILIFSISSSYAKNEIIDYYKDRVTQLGDINNSLFIFNIKEFKDINIELSYIEEGLKDNIYSSIQQEYKKYILNNSFNNIYKKAFYYYILGYLNKSNKKSISYYQTAIDILINDKKNYYYLLNELGKLYIKDFQYKKAKKIYIELIEKNKINSSIANIHIGYYDSLADIYFNLKEEQKALKSYQNILAIYKKYNIKGKRSDIVSILYSIENLAEKLNNTQSLIKIYDYFIDFYKKDKDIVFLYKTKLIDLYLNIDDVNNSKRIYFDIFNQQYNNTKIEKKIITIYNQSKEYHKLENFYIQLINNYHKLEGYDDKFIEINTQLSLLYFHQNKFFKALYQYIVYTVTIGTILIFIYSLIILFLVISYFRKIMLLSESFLDKNIHYSSLFNIKIGLKVIIRFQSFLSQHSIQENKYNQAIDFAKGEDFIRVEILKEVFNATSYSKEKDFYCMTLGDNFPLNLHEFLIYFTEKNIDELKEIIIPIDKPILIINDNATKQGLINEYANDPLNTLIAPTSYQITNILLKSNSIDIFAKIISQQQYLKDISPYKISGDVKKENMFFGRVDIIYNIINRNPQNYIVVGARQLGKSSLLQALYRRYREIASHYITLDKESDLVFYLSKALGVDRDMESIKEAIYNSPKPIIFLIDEVDEFLILSENSEKFTSIFRSLSQGGKAYFILAGFWELYKETLQPNSPLRNFGDIIKLEGLEEEACRELITKPMGLLGIGYSSPQIVEDIIYQTGRRSNLVSVICNRLILQIEGKMISKEDLESVLDSDFTEYISLGSVKIDRVIEYATIDKEKFYKEDLYEIFDKYNLEVDTIEIEESLNRLELSYVIYQKNGEYRYRVPLFVEKTIKSSKNIENLLIREIGEFKRSIK